MIGDPRTDMAHAVIDERVRVASEHHRARRRQVERMARAAAAGDATAWDWLITRFHKRLVSAARSQGLHHHDAEDAAQATWIRLTRHIGQLRDPASLTSWLITTARREGLRIRNRAPREQLTAEFAFEVPVEAEHDRELLEALRREALQEALCDLPERHRDLMQALLADPAPSYAEIAARLGIPIGSIGPTRARCLARLRKQSVLRELSDFGGS
jgi:RNA polymerase sigma factor (sigma-70 family)